MPTTHEAFARAALPSYGRGSEAPLRLLSLSENATWLVDDDRPLVLRVHRPDYHTQEAVESELDWVEAIRRDTPIAVPAPVAASDGRRVVSVAVGGLALLVDAMAFVPGAPADQAPGAFDVEGLGRIAGQLHQHASAWLRPAGFTRFRWDLDAIVGPDARWGDWRAFPGLTRGGRAAIERAASRVAQRVEAFGETPDRFGLIHGDLSQPNLLVDAAGGRGTITVLDFDDCGWSWFLADLAAVVASIDDPREAGRAVEAWLRGYGAVRPLPAEHLAMIPTFLMLRRIQLLAWYASHADSTEEPPRDFAATTAHMAERYLTDEGPSSR